jgi:Predicted metal-dependent hydrolase of the TIM-barrel fold
MKLFLQLISEWGHTINDMLEFFDCNCSFGMRGIVEPGSFHKVDDLMNRMKHYGIKKALIYHSMAREYNPVVGNKMLMDEIKNYTLFAPLWVVMHHHTDEFPEPGVLRKQLKECNVKAVRMFPATSEHCYSIAEWNCGELFSMLEACKVPLFIGLNQLDWNGLHGLCSSHPELRIILTDLNYSVDRDIYALLKKFANLSMETTGYKVHNGIEEICSRFGAQRLIFGSRMPEYSGGSAVSMINYARISEKEKEMIAGGNLEKLLGGVQL